MSATVYLAGKMAGLTPKQMSWWRNEATRELREAGFITLDPVEVYRAELKLGHETTAREIVDSNKYQIRHSDIVLAELNHPDLSIGTLGELVYASELRKPVIAWGGAWCTDHPWVKEHTTAIYNTMTEASECVIKKYSKVG